MRIPEELDCCATCKFYIQHYVKQRVSIFPINCGHCTNKKFKKLKNREIYDCCEFYERHEMPILEKRKIKVQEELAQMSECLNELKEYLIDCEPIDRK